VTNLLMVKENTFLFIYCVTKDLEG